MKKVNIQEFFKKSVLGGLVIVLPVAILAMGIRWLFRLVTDTIQPLTDLVVNNWGFPELFGDLIVLYGMVLLCFAVGWFVTTAGGRWFHNHFDDRLARYAPGYRVIKDIVDQFFGDSSKSPFANGEVALVQLFGEQSPAQVTTIVTSRHEDGRFTVFMPTGPNPTSGNIYHVPASLVTLRPDIKAEEAFRTIIACGAGSGDIFVRSIDGSVTESPESGQR